MVVARTAHELPSTDCLAMASTRCGVLDPPHGQRTGLPSLSGALRHVMHELTSDVNINTTAVESGNQSDLPTDKVCDGFWS